MATLAEAPGEQHYGAADGRGESMVKKHHEKIEAEREELALGKLQASLPRLSKKVLALALHNCRMDADRATMLLRQFQADNFEALEALTQKRKHSEQRNHRTEEGEGSDGEGADDSDDDSEPKKKRHKSSKSKKSKKEGKKEKKHKEKSKKDKKKRRREDDGDDEEQASRPQFGAWGIIRESDYAAKRAEFLAWASEVKRIDAESLPRGEERDLFRSFMEDYNTGSMPHDKYYDLEIYERKRAAKKAKRAAKAGVEPSHRQPDIFRDDERLRKAELLQQRKQQMDDDAHQAYTRLMMTGEHLKELKAREMMRLQMQDAYKTGDMDKAKRLMKKLNPDENEEERNPLDDWAGGQR